MPHTDASIDNVNQFPQKNTEKTRKPKKKQSSFYARLFRFIIRWMFALILLIFILVSFIIFYFTSTNLGAKHLIEVSNLFSGYIIQANKVEGRLIDELTLHNIQVKGDEMQLTAKEVKLSWSAKSLFNQKLHINHISTESVNVILKNTDNSNEDALDEEENFSLKDISLPIDIIIDEISVAEIKIIQANASKTSVEIIQDSIDEKGKVDNEAIKDVASNAGKKVAQKIISTDETVSESPIFIIDNASLAASYIDGTWQVSSFNFTNPDINSTLTAEGKTIGNYPVSLLLDSVIQAPEIGKVEITSHISGEIGESLQVVTKINGASKANIVVSINHLLEKSPFFYIAGEVKRVDFNDLGLRNKTSIPLNSFTSSINVRGDKHEIFANLKLNGTHTDFGDFDASVGITGDPMNKLDLSLFTNGFVKAELSGKVEDFITANGQRPQPNFDLKLNIQKISEKLLGIKDAIDFTGELSVKGKIDDLVAKLSAKADSAITGKVTAKTDVTFDGKHVVLKEFLLELPQTKQQLFAKADFNLSSEVISASIKSKAFSWPQNKPELFAKKLDIQLDGKLSEYTLTALGDIQVKDVPPMKLDINTSGNISQLTSTVVGIQILGGKVNATGNIAWAPDLNVDVNVNLNNIQPHLFYPDVNGKLSADLDVLVTQKNGVLSVNSELKDLTGRLRGQPVKGKGTVKLIGDKIDVKNLDLDLAGNRVLADGELSKTTMNLNYDIQASNLNKILPELSGAINGKGMLKGSFIKPNLAATLSARNIAYKDYRVRNANVKANIDVAKDDINVDIKTQGLTLDKEKIQSANLNVAGKFNKHKIFANLVSDARKAEMKANGGFSLDTTRWKGVISTFVFDEKSLNKLGNWKASNSVNLLISPKQLDVGNLCLVQASGTSAKICADGNLRDSYKNGKFEVTLSNVNSSLFKDYLPKEIKLDNILSGQTEILLKNGKPQIQGNISQNKEGRLTLLTGAKPFKEQIKQLSVDFSLKNNEVSMIADVSLKKLGTAKIRAGLPNFTKEQFTAGLRLDMPSLKPVESFVPDLANLKGSITGDIAVKGGFKSGKISATGALKLNKTDFDVPAYGTQIRALNLNVTAADNSQLLFNGSAQGGKGKLDITGSLNPLNQSGKVKIKGKNFRVAKSSQYFVELSPNMDVTFTDHLKIRGELGVPVAIISPSGGSGKSKVSASEDVVNPRKKEKKKKPTTPFDIDIVVNLGKKVKVNAQDISMGLGGEMKVSMRPNQVMKAVGTITTDTGRYRFYGQELEIKRGRVIFSGSPTNPSLDINAERDIEDDGSTVTAGVNILGYASRPEISLYSRPGLSDADILSYLAFGRRANSENFVQGVALQAAGAAGTGAIAKGVRESTGLDVFDLTLSGLEAGKHLSKKAYVAYKQNFFSGINEIIGKYHIRSCLKAEAKYSTGKDTGFDFICSFETD